MIAASPRQIDDAGARITFRVVASDEPRDVLPALARLLIGADRRRKQAAAHLDQVDDGHTHKEPAA